MLLLYFKRYTSIKLNLIMKKHYYLYDFVVDGVFVSPIIPGMLKRKKKVGE